MADANRAHSRRRVDILRWTARVGAVTAEALADRESATVPAARARLQAAVRDDQLSRRAPLARKPALYTITRAGMRASGSHGLGPCRVTPANASHLIACARVAAALERCYPDHLVLGERELRRDERRCGRPLASAILRPDHGRQPLVHRPDLVLWPRGSRAGLPVAVEVELTVKSRRRLTGICLAWARCRCVAGVLYLTAPGVEGALSRALAQVDAGERIVAVPLTALPRSAAATPPSIANAVAGDA